MQLNPDRDVQAIGRGRNSMGRASGIDDEAELNGKWRPFADYANSIDSMQYTQAGASIFPYHHYFFWREFPTAKCPEDIIAKSINQLPLLASTGKRKLALVPLWRGSNA